MLFSCVFFEHHMNKLRVPKIDPKLSCFEGLQFRQECKWDISINKSQLGVVTLHYNNT